MNIEDIRDIIKNNRHLFGYNAVISQQDIRHMFNLNTLSDAVLTNMSGSDIRKAIRNEDLEELTVIGQIKSYLLDQGRIIVKERDNYRVLKASENTAKALKYYEAARRKVSIAKKLLLNTPRQYQRPDTASVVARVDMVDDTINRSHKEISKLVKHPVVNVTVQ